MDILTPDRRSWNMSRIRSKNTSIEMLIRSALHRRGFRYRVNQSNLPGKPDIVLKKHRAIIFINGCFWHFHGCKNSKIPEARHNWWQEKLTLNRERDKSNITSLLHNGWRVLIVWECAIKHASKDSLQKTLERIECWIKSSSEYGYIDSDTK